MKGLGNPCKAIFTPSSLQACPVRDWSERRPHHRVYQERTTLLRGVALF